VVFAENVESVNGSLQNLKDALSTQEKLVEQNKELIAQLDGLKQVTLRSSEQSVNAMKQAAVDISVTNKQLAANIADGIAAEMQSMATRVGRDIAAMEEASAASRADMMATISQTKDGERVAANQRMIIKNMNDLAAQNKEIIRKFDEKDNRVSYP
jgi:regulatory protein YycI of two-component signal transduction system YycFG